MISVLAHKIAYKIKRANPEKTASIDVMKYALIVYLQALCIIVTSLIIGWLTGKISEMMIAMFAFSILRSFSGGRHLRTAEGCFIFSVLMFTGISQIPQLTSYIIHAINIISLLLLLLFAPKPDPNVQLDSKNYPFMKVISAAIVISNFLFMSQAASLSFFIQSLSLISIRRR